MLLLVVLSALGTFSDGISALLPFSATNQQHSVLLDCNRHEERHFSGSPEILAGVGAAPGTAPKIDALVRRVKNVPFQGGMTCSLRANATGGPMGRGGGRRWPEESDGQLRFFSARDWYRPMAGRIWHTISRGGWRCVEKPRMVKCRCVTTDLQWVKES